MKYHKKDLKNKLNIIGLSDREADIYLSALELGPCTVLQLARVSGIKRSSIYPLIEGLECKGLMNTVLEGFKKKYEALPPTNLEQHLVRQQRELESCLPELEALHASHAQQSLIRVYRGKEAMYSAYDWMLDQLKPSDDYLVFGNLEAWYNTDPDFFAAWPLRRREVMRHGRSIFFDGPMARQYQTQQGNYQTSVKILPTKRSFKAIKLISTRFMFIHQTGKPEIVFVIENPAVITMYKEMFELMWEMVD